MRAYWITFEDDYMKPRCCEGQTERDVRIIAEKLMGGSRVKSVEFLPYPAHPVIWQFDHPVHGKTPTFCRSPETCKGKTACPRSRSCTS